MKILFIHVIAILLIKRFCVSQFHQDDYDIVHDRIDVTRVNKTACVDLVLAVVKYNDTLKMKAINISAFFTPGVQKNILFKFAVLRLVKKKYRLFPFPNITIDLCEEYKNLEGKNPFGIQTAIQNSNFRGCPCAKGLYYLYNWILEQEKFPPHIPPGDYKLNFQMRVDDKIFMFNGAWYGSVIKKKT